VRQQGPLDQLVIPLTVEAEYPPFEVSWTGDACARTHWHQGAYRAAARRVVSGKSRRASRECSKAPISPSGANELRSVAPLAAARRLRWHGNRPTFADPAKEGPGGPGLLAWLSYRCGTCGPSGALEGK
jgi:hypothetical protein